MEDSIVSGINTLQSKGFTTQFMYVSDSLIDRATGTSYNMEACRLVSYERYEGMSDPGDSSILMAIVCEDGNRGYISSAYGIYADHELLRFVEKLERVNES
jgi:hypothetical protein